MSKIKLSRGHFAIVDDEDYERLNKRKWYANGHFGRPTYAISSTKINGKQTLLRMHRVLLGLVDSKLYGEHKNGNGLDNRKSNLRIATSSQNQANRGLPKNNTSGYKGVQYNPTFRAGSCNNKGESKPWEAMIRVRGKLKLLGMYFNKEKAALAYDRAAIKYFGKFAKLNLEIKHG